MIMRVLSFLMLSGWALSCAACGNSHGLYPVRGKVLFKGEPAVGATVTFVRKGTIDRLKEQVPQGVVAEDGTFRLKCSAGDGACPGDYAVLVEWKEGAGKGRGRAPGLNAPDRLRGRYLNPDKPLLQAAVKPTGNDLPPFELN
jgi:hypothetical protein